MYILNLLVYSQVKYKNGPKYTNKSLHNIQDYTYRIELSKLWLYNIIMFVIFEIFSKKKKYDLIMLLLIDILFAEIKSISPIH